MMSNREADTLLVDAHVHIYDCFDVESLLDAALRNFKSVAKKAGVEQRFKGVLLLTETYRDNWFQQLSLPAQFGHWLIYETRDKTVLLAKQQADDIGTEIYIVAGRQIITAEGLELLALATDSEFEDGLPVASLLQVVREQDAIPVLPWAVGKWLGKRGKLLTALLEAEMHSDLCLGDNSGRPVFWYNPVHFKQAKKSRMPLLPGSDSLPFSSEVDRVGRFGFMMRGKLTQSQPSADLKQLLRNNEVRLTPYGRLESPLRFITNQIRLRIA